MEISSVFREFLRGVFLLLLMAEIRRSPVEVGSLSHDLQGLDIPGAGFINSSSGIMKRNPFGGESKKQQMYL